MPSIRPASPRIRALIPENGRASFQEPNVSERPLKRYAKRMAARAVGNGAFGHAKSD